MELRKKTSGLAAAIAAMAILVLAGNLIAQVPQKVNYQGRLTDLAGLPLPGPHSMTYRIYDVSGGGTALWTESKIDTADASGVISTVLGSSNPLDSAFAGPRWLEVVVDGETLLPRREIVSAAFAIHAANADSLGGMHSSSFSLVGHTHDERYYTETELNTSDGDPPNVGSNQVSWNNLVDVPAGFADSIDNVGILGDTVSYAWDADKLDGMHATEFITGVTAGAGLSGGGTSGNVTANVGQGTGIIVESDAVVLDTAFTDARYLGSTGFGFVAEDNGSEVEDVTSEAISAQVTIPPGAVTTGVVVTACGYYTALGSYGSDYTFRARLRVGSSGTLSDEEYTFTDYRSEGMSSGDIDRGNLNLTAYVSHLNWAQQNYITVSIQPNLVDAHAICKKLVVFGY